MCLNIGNSCRNYTIAPLDADVGGVPGSVVGGVETSVGGAAAVELLLLSINDFKNPSSMRKRTRLPVNSAHVSQQKAVHALTASFLLFSLQISLPLKSQ